MSGVCVLLALLFFGEFTVYTVDGKRIQAESVEYSIELSAESISVAKDSRIPVGEISHIENNDSVTSVPQRFTIIFVDGSRIYCDSLRVSESRIIFHSNIVNDVSVSSVIVDKIIVNNNFNARLEEIELSEYEDVLVRSNGDVSKGVMVAIENEKIRFKSDVLGELTFSMEEIALIKLVSTTSREQISGKWRVLLSDGSRINGQLLKIDDKSVSVSALEEVVINLPLKHVVSLSYENPNFRYLSDVDPVEAVVKPHAVEGLPELKRDFQRDLSAKKTIISINGKKFSKGIGVRAMTMLKYHLGGEYRFFLASIGVDDCVDPLARKYADVKFLVHGDGKLLFESSVKKYSDPPEEIKVDVSGVRILQLTVEFGETPEIGDWADWASARVVK